MDYTMESLSVDDVRIGDEKFPVQSSSYDGSSLEHREHLIQGNQAYKSNHHEVNLLEAAPLHITISSHTPRVIGGKDSDIQRQYGVECTMIAENVYQTRSEVGPSFDRPFLYNGDSKIRSNEIDTYSQEGANRQSYIYGSEDSLLQGSMSTTREDGLSRYPLNSVDDARLVANAVDLEQESKVSARCGSYEPVVSDFLPETPQNKEQYYLIVSSGRGTHCNEAEQDTSVQSQQLTSEGSSVFTQMMPQTVLFPGIDFQRAQQFSEVQEAGNTLCLGNPSTQEGLYCHSTDVLDISKRQNGEVGFENGAKTSEEMSEPSILVDDAYSEQMEDASAAEALMTLQGDAGAAFGVEPNRSPELSANQASDPYATLQDISDSHQRVTNGQHYLSNSDTLPPLVLQTVNSKGKNKKQSKQNTHKSKKEHSSTDVDNSANKLAKISRKDERKLKQDDVAVLKSVDKVNKKGRHKVSRTKVANSDRMKTDKNSVSGKDTRLGKILLSFKEGKANKNTDVSQAVPAITETRNLLLEDDTASVQSPPPSPIDKKRKFKCKLCKRTWKFRKDLNKHMKTHAATKKFTCSVCSCGFINRTLLKKHLLTHSEMKFFTCPQCSATCDSLAELKTHQQTHARAEVFSCSECSFTTKRQTHLDKHMLVHSATKVYNCQFCKFSSKRKYSLQRHVKTAHSSAQIHECSVCDFNTNSLDSFKVHVAMHASTRSMSCLICGAVVKKRPNLIEHLLSHSNDEDTTCKECGETYTTSHEYLLHLLNHKDLSSPVPGEVSKDSVFDLSSPSLKGSVDSAPGVFGFLSRTNKAIMDTPAMEAKLAQMSTVASRLADMTKVVTLLNEKPKVVFQLAEISTLATELAVISGNVLQSYRNTYGVAADATASKDKATPSSNEATDDSSDEDDYKMPLELSIPVTKIKEELQEHAYLPSEADMQIQVDFNGTPVSCVQKDDPLKLETAGTSTGNKVLKCSRCSMTFTDSRSLKRHLLAHDNVRPYYCSSCGRSFRRNEHLKKHMVTHSDDRPFTCRNCPYAAKTEHRLKIHALCHSQSKAYSCQHCTYTARTNYELNHHMKRHEPRSCSQCSFVCYSRAELKKHVFTHSSFGCTECDFTTSDRAEYTRHMKRHTPIQHLCCELCGYSCDTMKKFKYHKLRHDNKTPYQCQDCDYRCSSRASFDCHRLKHAGLKPYLCSFCGASFRKTSHLNQHLLIHKDEKAFKCSECNYSCRTKHNLKEHEMTHSGEKPFSCRYCSFSCRRNKALQLHMLKHDSSGMMIPSLQMSTMGFPHLQIPLQMPIMPS